MSQDIRRRLAARTRLQPPRRREADVAAPLRIRHFGEGLERAVLDQLRAPNLGRSSQGAERRREDARSKTRIGR